jgi:hypothetical protein
MIVCKLLYTYLIYDYEDERSLEALRSHSAQLVDVVAVYCVSVDDSGRMSLLHWLLSNLNAVVHNKQGIIRT